MAKLGKSTLSKAFAGIMNKGGSIFGNLEEIGALDINKEVELEKIYNVGRFEVRMETKKHKSPYVTMELDGTVYSGYATAIGNKLHQILTVYGTVDGTHEFYDAGFDVHGLQIYFKAAKSEAGEYLDIFAVEEEEAAATV